MISILNSGAVQEVTPYPEFRFVSQKLQSFPDKVWYEDGPIATATTSNDRIYSGVNTSGNTNSDQYSPTSTKPFGTKTFSYPINRTSTDITHRRHSSIEEEGGQAVNEIQKSPTSPSHHYLKSSGAQNTRLIAPLNYRVARDSLSLGGSRVRQKKHNPKPDSISEIPPVPLIRSSASEGALSDAYVDRAGMGQAHHGPGHVRFPSSASNKYRTHRLESPPFQDICCTQSHHSFLEKKMESLEAKIDNLVPALIALTKALNGLSAKFDNGAVTATISSMQPPIVKESGLGEELHAMNHGQPTPGPDVFKIVDSFFPDTHRASRDTRPLWGSVSERGGALRSRSADQSRRGSKLSKASPNQTSKASPDQNDIESYELQKSHDFVIQQWGERPRQQSCFDPDTSDDEVEEVEEIAHAPSRNSAAGSNLRFSKSTTNLRPPSPIGSARLALKTTRSASQLPVPTSKKSPGRSAPPPPVKIFPLKTEYTARRGTGTSSALSQIVTQTASPERAASPQTKFLSPGTDNYTRNQMVYRELAPLPLVPHTAGLMQPSTHQVLKTSAEQPIAKSLPASPRAKLSPSRLEPYTASSSTTVQTQTLRSRKESIQSMTNSVKIVGHHKSDSDSRMESLQSMASSVRATGHQQLDSSSPPARPSWYFFYGALTDPSLLAEILRLPSLPVLQSARIQSHTLKYYGPYPCAVSGASSPNTEVGPRNETRDGIDGKAWYVPSAEMALALRRREEDGFQEVCCELNFLAGAPRPPGASASESGVIGRMFEWRGPESQLSDTPCI